MNNKNALIGMIASGVVCFVVYLVMRKYVFGDEIKSEDYIIAGAISVGIVVGQIISNKRKNKNND